VTHKQLKKGCAGLEQGIYYEMAGREQKNTLG